VESSEPSAPDPHPPAPDRPGARPRTIAGALLVAAVIAAVALSLRDRDRATAAPPPPPADANAKLPVRVAEVAAEAFAPVVSATGTLLANESVVLVAEVSRRLVRIHAAEGSTVKRGDVLFELDDADLIARAGRMRAQKGLAKRILERDDRLVAPGIVAEELLDESRTRVTDVQAQIDELAVMLGKTRIRAPFAGTLGIRHVSEGAWVGPDVPLASLYDTSRLKLDFRVPERYASSIAVDQPFSFRVSGRNERFSGRVLVVEPQIEARTRSLLVRGVVDEPEGLRPGQFATVSLETAGGRALFVPSIAVLPSERGHRVFVERGGVAHEVAVELGHRTAERVEVVEGLAEGDRVILTNLLRVREGSAVEALAIAVAQSGEEAGTP
jgi:membrane fusion protein (multidrug efflux system)